MNQKLIGQLIRRERIARDWSQEGLCKGICAVSYLSKIEQGKTSASAEILSLLLERLSVDWYEDETAAACCGRCFSAIFERDRNAYHAAINELNDNWNRYNNGPNMLDTLILRSWDMHSIDPLLFEFELDIRQKTLLLLLQERNDEAVLLNPCGFTLFQTGVSRYEAGQYPQAIEYLQQSYELASRDGFVHLMLECQMFLGNCCSNLLDLNSMLGHYRIAERIAAAVGDNDMLESLRYNTAATKLELGRYEEAYLEFMQLRAPTAMAWHKIAICCEKTGRHEEAFQCLSKAESSSMDLLSPDFVHQLCELVRFRLEHGDYLSCAEYGQKLLSAFERMRTSLPHGYAAFHLPWVLEWHKANRQYKQALELMSGFPSPTRFS